MKLLDRINSIEIDKTDNFIKFIRLVFIVFIFASIFLVSELLNGYRNYKYEDINIFYKIVNFMDYVNEASSIEKILKTVCFYSGIYLVLKGITKKTNASLRIILAIFTIFGIINYIVMDTRGVGISFPDFFVIKTALSVANSINFKFRIRLLFVIPIFLMDFFIFKFISKATDDNISAKKRLLSIFVGVLLLTIFSLTTTVTSRVNMWDINDAYHKSGVPATLLQSFVDGELFYGKSQYNKQRAEEVLSLYEPDEKDDENEYPNVLIVFNESFVDVNAIYNFNLKKDNLPFYHSLLKRENTISGYTYSSVFGGGTSIPEYVLLTQNNSPIIFPYSSPYIEFEASDFKNTIINHYRELNYDTVGIHAYYKSGYNRNNIWEALGFNKRIFLEDMNFEKEYLYDDNTTYNYYYKEMNSKIKRNFSFVLTMQNHKPYYNRGVETKENSYVNEKELDEYLQYIKLSDDALKELINFVDNYEEKIIVLFLGDHQPFFEEFSDKNLKSEYKDDVSAKYIVPFFIYANYDISHEENARVSMHYLQNLLCKEAGIPLNSYSKYLENLNNIIPITTPLYYEAQNGTRYSYEDKTSPYYKIIEDYKNIIKYEMFK